MWLIVGLGNPGEKYEDNRHNIGFMAVDEIFHRHNFTDEGKKFKAQVASGFINAEKVLLLKPQTFMNLSGEAVLAATTFYKIPPENIIVIHDDLDLEPSKLRIKQGGGAGGHNGLKSIDSHLGKDYWRVRIGIGHPGDKNLVSNYVLNDFSKADREWGAPLLKSISDNIGFMIKGEKDKFATNVALDMSKLVKDKE